MRGGARAQVAIGPLEHEVDVVVRLHRVDERADVLVRRELAERLDLRVDALDRPDRSAQVASRDELRARGKRRARARAVRRKNRATATRRRHTHVVFVDALERVFAVLARGGVGVLVDDARADFAELALAEVPEHEVLSDAPVRFAQVRVQLGQGRLVLPEREALGARDATHGGDTRALRPPRMLGSQDLEGFTRGGSSDARR